MGSVPLADPVAAAIDGLSRRPYFTDPTDYVFGSEIGRRFDPKRLRGSFYDALEAAGIPRDRHTGGRLTWHCLRHTFGTLAIQRAPVTTVQAWMGHAHLATTERYLHHVPRHQDAALLTSVFAPAQPDTFIEAPNE